MKDAFHGSAHPQPGLVDAHRDSTSMITTAYRGSTAHCPRRGLARTTPIWIRRAGGGCTQSISPIRLEDQAPWAAIPCWSGGAHAWAHGVVPAAYAARYETHVRPAMPGNPISLRSLIKVAQVRAEFADRATGRNCRPTNALLARMTRLSIRTVQRASTALRLLGVATEVLRGRQRTRDERFASWRVGDRGRGWASVWALHDSRFRVLSPHPGGSPVRERKSRKEIITTHPQRKSAGSSAAKRRTCPDNRALALANRWIRDPQTPPWARRYHTGTPWARILTGPAAHGWTARDINQLITDWIGTGHWLPDFPHKPIGLLGAILAWHDNLEERPAAADEAREKAELAASRQRIATQLAQRDADARAREQGRAALNGPGRAAVRQVLEQIAKRTRGRPYPGGEEPRA
jgi:hypothetical protein